MKVLVNGYIGRNKTGIGRTLIETLDRVARLNPNHEYIIYTNFDNQDLVAHAFPNNILVKTYPISKSSPIKNLLFNVFVFPFISLKESVDIVYLPNFTMISFKFRPIVSVIHDMIEFKVERKFSKMRMCYRHMIVPRMAKVSDHVITISKNSKCDIIEICKVKPEKISVVYCAVSDEFKSGKQTIVIPNFEYMLYVGTVDHPGKNVYNALKAFEKFKEGNSSSDLKFIICGMQGKGFNVVDEAMKKSPFREDIMYKGYVNDEMLVSYYSRAKLFIFISYYEGFGLPVLEAMKSGVPVITSDRSSLPEVAGDAALVVNVDDIEEIKSAIEKIIKNKETAAELVKRGYANLKRFSWDKTAMDTLKVFELVHKAKSMRKEGLFGSSSNNDI